MKNLNLKIFPQIPKLDGLKLAYGCAGIKSKTKLDISIIVFEDFAYVASVLTKSKTCAANIIWLKKINKFGKVKVLFVNSGNANAYTGKEGYNNLLKIVNYFVKSKLCKKSEIIISSTGVIGEQLPIKKILNYLPTLIENKKLKPVTHTAQWKCFANSILTTDTFIKGSYLESKIGNKKVKIIGISKGSGMIAPNMATMLGYFFTDALLPPNILKRLLIDVCEKTFNSITVDGDTSTNDMVSFISTRKIACEVKSINDDKLKQFKMDLNKVALQLAKKIILDGEDLTFLSLSKRSKLGISYLPQQTSIFRGLSVYENLLGVAQIVKKNRNLCVVGDDSQSIYSFRGANINKSHYKIILRLNSRIM